MAQSNNPQFQEMIAEFSKTLKSLNETANQADNGLEKFIGAFVGIAALFSGFKNTVSNIDNAIKKLTTTASDAKKFWSTEAIIPEEILQAKDNNNVNNQPFIFPEYAKGIQQLTAKIQALISSNDNLIQSNVALLNGVSQQERGLVPVVTAIDNLRNSFGEFSDVIDAEFTVLSDRLALPGNGAGGMGGGGGGGGGQPPPIPPDDEGKNFWSKLIESAKSFGEILYNVAKNVRNKFRVLDNQLTIAKNDYAALFQAQSVVVGSLDFLRKTISTLTKEFLYLTAATTFFVNALAPAYVEQFLYTLKDLTAVIGTAFLPLIQTFTNLARVTADLLLPLFEQMQPIFEKLSFILLNLLVPILMSVVEIFKTLFISLYTAVYNFNNLAAAVGNLIANIIQALLPVFNSMLATFNALVMILTPVIKFLEYFGYLIGTVISGYVLVSFMATLFSAISALVSFIAGLTAANIQLALLTAGLSLVVGGLAWLISKLFTAKKQVQYQPNISQGIAARQAQYMSAEDISKNLIKAAFAGPNADRLKNIDMNGRKQVELLEQIANKRQVANINQVNQRGLAVA